VACAAALATLDVIDDEGLLDRAATLGTRALERLRAELAGHPAVRDVRGRGLMIGIELADKATTTAVCDRCLDAGVLALACGPDENVLRLVPPLTITDDELDLGLGALVAAITAA
jgi:4-aminobutyrate aminotransferase-like enzyme